MQGPPVGHGRNLSPDKDASGTVAQCMEIPTGMLDGLPRTVQQHPNLRFRFHHLVVGHSEESAVEEQLVIVADQSLPRTCKASRA